MGIMSGSRKLMHQGAQGHTARPPRNATRSEWPAEPQDGAVCPRHYISSSQKIVYASVYVGQIHLNMCTDMYICIYMYIYIIIYTSDMRVHVVFCIPNILYATSIYMSAQAEDKRQMAR